MGEEGEWLELGVNGFALSGAQKTLSRSHTGSHSFWLASDVIISSPCVRNIFSYAPFLVCLCFPWISNFESYLLISAEVLLRRLLTEEKAFHLSCSVIGSLGSSHLTRHK